MSLAKEADDLVNGPRAAAYGAPIDNFQRIASYWNLWLDARLDEPITARDVGWMMALLKMAREQHAPHPAQDNLRDALGYLACVEKVDDALRERAANLARFLASKHEADDAHAQESTTQVRPRPDVDEAPVSLISHPIFCYDSSCSICCKPTEGDF